MNILKRISLLLSFVVMTSLMSASPSSAEALTITGPATIAAVVGTSTSATYTASGGTGPYTLAISTPMVNGFTATESAPSMLVSGNAVAAQTDSYTITVTDSTSATASITFSVSATIPPLVITGPATIAAVVGTSTSATYTASGGTGPYTLAISTPMVNGFTATESAPSMLVSGNAVAAQTDSYTITVTDSTSATASITFSVSATIPPLVITGPATIAAVVGTSTSATYTASGGTGPYTLAISTPMVNGFTATESAPSMLVSGNAVAAQTDSYTITVTDSTSATASITFSVSATIPPLVITGPATIAAVVGTSTSATYTASGGTGPYTLDLVGTLPAGFTFSSSGSSLTVTGTATAPIASGSYTVTVTDSSAPTALTITKDFTLSADYVPLAISGASISAVVGTPTSVTYTASGGTGPYTIDLVGTLPADFTFSSTSTTLTVTGTATAPIASTPFTITVTDSSAPTALTMTKDFTLSADYAPLTLTGPATIAAVVGTSTSATYTASGGSGSYTLDLVGTLPADFTFSSSGSSLTVIGTATAPIASGSYTVTVTDTFPTTTTLGFTLSADYAPLAITGPATISATVGTPTSTTYTVSGGSGTYTSIVISAEIGNGFTTSTSANSLVINGNPITAQSATVYTITATDDSGATKSMNVTLTSNYPPLNIIGPSRIDILLGYGESIAYSVSGAVGDVTYSAPTPVEGISITSSFGNLTVASTVPVGIYSIVVSVVDSRGASGTLNVVISVGTSTSGTGTKPISNELKVIAPSLQITEGQALPLLTPTYSNRNSVSTLAICEIFTPEKKIAEEIYAGQYDILCRGVTTNDGSKVIYISGVLKVAIKPQDPAETKLDALIERPRVIYVSPNVEVNSKISLQNSRGNTIISVHFDEKTVLLPTSFYFTPWPINTVDKATPVLNISAKDNKGTAINSLEKPMSLKFPKVPANSIPAFSTDGNDWINFPQITKSDLAEGILEGFYTDANGEITIFTEELGLIGFRLAQKSFALSVRNKKSLYGLTEAVQVKTPRLLGTGEISYQSLLPRACSISNDGIVKTITGGECLVIAKKASDSKYSTTTSEVLTLKFTVPPTPKPTPKPSVKPTKSPSTKPTTGPTPPVTAPKAPKGYAIIPGIDGVFTPTKDGGTKNNAVLKLGAQISGEFNQQLNSQFSVSLSGLDKGAVISPILVTPEGLSAILQSGKYDSTKQYVSQSLKFTKTGTYKIIFRIAGTNTARVISINIK